MTDYAKLAEDALERTDGWAPASAKALCRKLARALLACDREREEAVAQRDEYGRDQYQQGIEDAEAEARRYRDALERIADATAWSMRNEDLSRWGFDSGPWYFNARDTDERPPWIIAREALGESA